MATKTVRKPISRSSKGNAKPTGKKPVKGSDSHHRPQTGRQGRTLTKGSRVLSQRMSEAPVRPYPGTAPDKESAARIAQASKAGLKDAQKASKESLVAELVSGRTGPAEAGVSRLSELNASQLGKVAKSLNDRWVAKTGGSKKDAPYSGYSTLSGSELAIFLATGDKPAPKSGTTRALKTEAAGLKAAGKLTGAVSAAKVADLKKAVAAARSAPEGEPVAVAKSSPNKGTVEWFKSELRRKAGVEKGYGKYAELAKAEGLGSISAMKAAELKEFCKKQGIVA